MNEIILWYVFLPAGNPSRQDVEEPLPLPAHTGPLKAGLNDVLACPFNSARAHRQPAVPRHLVLEARPMVLHRAQELGKPCAHHWLLRPQALERAAHIADTVRKERSNLLLYPGFRPGWRRGQPHGGTGVELLAQMIRIPRLADAGGVGVGTVPDPGSPVAMDKVELRPPTPGDDSPCPKTGTQTGRSSQNAPPSVPCPLPSKSRPGDLPGR